MPFLFIGVPWKGEDMQHPYEFIHGFVLLVLFLFSVSHKQNLTEVYNYIQSFLVACCCFRMYNGRWWMYLYCLLDICFPIIYHIWKFIGCWCSSAGTIYLVRWT
jgi:hypothetical protein